MSLTAETEAILERLRGRDLLSAAELEAAVARHLDEVRAAAVTQPFVDLDTAEEVAGACLDLLRRWPLLDPGSRRSIQAACLYFAETDDGEDDLNSVIGFDDDLEVVRYIAAVVEGR